MSHSQTHSEKLKKLEELIHDINIAMLVTTASDGTLRSRPMGTQCKNFDGTLWFFTDREAAKVIEVQKNPQVNVSYANRDDQKYVSVSGTAQVVENREKIRELWTPFAKIWFPDGADDPRIALLRVDVSTAEYWDSPSSTYVLVTGFMKAALSGHRPTDLGEHEKVNL